jgi:hypothetical protein
MPTAPKRAPLTRPVALRDTRRRRIHTVSFDPVQDDWLETIVGILAAEGHPNAARSEIIRVALLGLRDTLAGRTRQDITKFFVQRDADRLLASFEGPPLLPFD